MSPGDFEENERQWSFPEPPPRDPGNFLQGCALGCMVQIGALILAIAGAQIASGRTSLFLISSFAVTQWVGLIPLISRENSMGHGQTSGGMITAGILGIIVGCIVFMVGSACGPGLFL